ncbi:FAD-dependent monooxygenase [Deinococcus aestuarii]|uniref:FAD-dependent monooxygenase n=1 Tax=Deinococcus aestuarii TaxID=2774531 RepID=UPI001C0ABA7B|nr:FAD-dependent monooxygenase [Deinococcus aestuarii]
MTVDVLIAGAGPTGLLLACELRRRGVRVLVADPKTGPTRESRAMFVQARSLEIYDALGLAREAVRQGRPARGASLWSGRRRLGGVAFGPVGAGRTPYPYILAFEQSANEELLSRHLRALGGEVAWGWALEGFTQGAGGVRATLRGPGGERREVGAAYLCGADGAHSPVRHALATPFEGERSPRTLFVADVAASGALDGAAVNLKLGADSLLLAFPMAGPGHFRLIGLVPGAEPGGEAPTFEAVRPVVASVFGVAVQEVRWFSHYRVSHRVARKFRTGRVFLLGDAAHIHSPVGGQGMNTGLGDAHNLGWKLAAVVRGEAGPDLLASYEPERRPFARSLVNTTDRVFRLISGDTPLARLGRGTVLPAALGRLLGGGRDGEDRAGEHPGPLARLAFGLLSQTRLSYPHSPLSVGRAGRVRGGDRLPYVPGSGNFGALREPGAQVHVYGVPSPGVIAWTARHEGVALRVFPFGGAAGRAGLMEDAAYLVRPDGYVSVAQPTFDGGALDRVLAGRWHWRR